MIQAYEFSAYDLIGFAGFALYMTNYTLLTLGIVAPAQCRYFAINLGASCLVMISLTANFNAASALLQAFWIVMSVVGLSLRALQRTRKRKAPYRSDAMVRRTVSIR